MSVMSIFLLVDGSEIAAGDTVADTCCSAVLIGAWNSLTCFRYLSKIRLSSDTPICGPYCSTTHYRLLGSQHLSCNTTTVPVVNLGRGWTPASFQPLPHVFGERHRHQRCLSKPSVSSSSSNIGRCAYMVS